MSARTDALLTALGERFGPRLQRVESRCGELGFEVALPDLVDACRILRDDFAFEMLVDLCGVDYLTWGQGEWETQDATSSGFSRAAVRATILPDPAQQFDSRRFAVVYHLLSVSQNYRLRLSVYTGVDNPPVVPSVIDIWASANWYEREAFDL